MIRFGAVIRDTGYPLDGRDPRSLLGAVIQPCNPLEATRDSRVVSALASCARGPGFDPRRRRGKFVGPNLLPFVSFAGMT